ncbi:MAG: nucleotide sugar dehydrogenase [Deltaproteobacteria bacterium]|nr:nucleotide sugar dehydrogenase [Deltaproteobacteria bacterium]MBW2532142.1 nucleotide sugar dehydrogenase [Deltaproteobacteria bacterium]
MATLLAKLETRSAQVTVVGAGQVGLPLAVAFAEAGLSTVALDCDRQVVEAIGGGRSPSREVDDDALSRVVASKRLRATTHVAVLHDADAVVICVPTPLNKTREPDLRHVIDVVDAVAREQHRGMLVVLESTTYPGTTMEVVVPRLTSAGFALGRDVFVAFSPERVDPGNTRYGTRNTPKVVGGATPGCQRVALALYGAVIDQLVPVSSPDAAEMAKLLENTYRAVNIALANEFALMAKRLGVDIWEVIRAASTKPFGFMPFYPGPGLGGRCIPVDPLYLSWRMRSLDFDARLIALADLVNGSMPDHVVSLVHQALNDVGQPVRGAKLLIVGLAYKRDVPDHRESPAFAIIDALLRLGATVDYLDPEIPAFSEAGLSLRSVPDDVDFSRYDTVVIVTDHSRIDYRRLLADSPLVVDTRNALEGVPGDHRKVVKL